MARRLILDVDTGTDDAVAIMHAALHPDLCLTFEVALGYIGVAHLCPLRAGLNFQWWLGATGYLEIRLAL